MQQINELFLDILRAALRGRPFTPTQTLTAEQWQSLVQLAAIHKVEPLLWETVYASGAMQQAAPELAASVKRQVRQQVILQTLRTSEFLALSEALRKAGIDAIVVKGITCRTLYPRPDHRPSADEDLLIPAAQYDACREVFARFGLMTPMEDREAADSYEVPFRKPGSPLYIELHKQLFPEVSDAYGDLNRFFGGVFERAAEVTACGGIVRTTAPTDHLFYLICHAFKHFLHSGFGIRQICDILLFAEHHGSELDWAQILQNCRAIRADRFAAAIFAIGQKHLGFDPDRAKYPADWRAIRVDEGPLLADVLCAGVYGTADDSRPHSSTITLDAVAAQKEGRRARGALLAAAFPSAKDLEGRYPWLKRHPYLLPAAWGSRILDYARRSRSGSNAAEAMKLGSERIGLLKQYGILK